MYLDIIAERTPDKAALVMAGSGTTITYDELNRRTIQAANLFRHHGLNTGDSIAIYMENSIAFIEAALGAVRAGLYFVPIGKHLKSEEVTYLLADSAAKILIASPQTIRTFAVRTTPPAAVEHVYITGGTIDPWLRWSDAIAAQAWTETPGDIPGSPMFYSSGTTGNPKGIRMPLGGALAKYWSEPFTHEWPPESGVVHTENNINLIPGPLYHVSPFSFCLLALQLGATAVIMEVFDPEWVLQLIERHRITHIYLVPTMFVRLLMVPKVKRTQIYDLSSLRHVEHGSGPCAIDVKERMIEWLGPILYEVYGASEPHGSTFINSADWLRHKGSVGKAVQSVAIHILDEHQNELPPGSIGDVYFSGMNIEFEYHNSPDKRKSQSTKEGWFCYGDIGSLDEEGYLYLKDRKSHTIIVGGQNVYSQEIENLLGTHPLIFDVAVIGVPDSIYGEEVRAYIQLCDPKDNNEATKVQLNAFCKERLADIKCPKEIIFVPSLHRTEHGKLRKGLLKAQVAQDAGVALQPVATAPPPALGD